MSRPAKVNFDQFTDSVALEAAVSIFKTEKHFNVASFSARVEKRVRVEEADRALFDARVLATLQTLASAGKVTLDGDKVQVVLGKRGRPRLVKVETAVAAQ